MNDGRPITSCGSRNQSAAAEAARSSTEIANCRSASAGAGKRTVQRAMCSSRQRIDARIIAAAISRIAAAIVRNSHAGRCSTPLTCVAPHKAPLAPRTSMPTPNAVALKAMACATLPASTPAAV